MLPLASCTSRGDIRYVPHAATGLIYGAEVIGHGLQQETDPRLRDWGVTLCTIAGTLYDVNGYPQLQYRLAPTQENVQQLVEEVEDARANWMRDFTKQAVDYLNSARALTDGGGLVAILMMVLAYMRKQRAAQQAAEQAEHHERVAIDAAHFAQGLKKIVNGDPEASKMIDALASGKDELTDFYNTLKAKGKLKT